jgi:hypothetical protein
MKKAPVQEGNNSNEQNSKAANNNSLQMPAELYNGLAARDNEFEQFNIMGLQDDVRFSISNQKQDLDLGNTFDFNQFASNNGQNANPNANYNNKSRMGELLTDHDDDYAQNMMLMGRDNGLNGSGQKAPIQLRNIANEFNMGNGSKPNGKVMGNNGGNKMFGGNKFGGLGGGQKNNQHMNRGKMSNSFYSKKLVPKIQRGNNQGAAQLGGFTPF